MSGQESSKIGLQPLDLHQRVLALLVYLDQHGFRMAYELSNRGEVVWIMRPIDKPDLAPELPLQEPCHEELYFSWARIIVQLD